MREYILNYIRSIVDWIVNSKEIEEIEKEVLDKYQEIFDSPKQES